MSVKIICTLITTAGAIIAALLSWLISRNTANKEMEKLKIQWEREVEKLNLQWKRDDIVTSDDDFAEMASAVAEYIAGVSEELYRDKGLPMAKVSAVRSRETGPLAIALDHLYAALHTGSIKQIDSSLTEVINQKRSYKQGVPADCSH